jgi:hypothetical protein
LSKKVFVLGLNNHRGHAADDVFHHIKNILDSVTFEFHIKKRTRAGCVVVEADEELLESIAANHPDLFVEEQKSIPSFEHQDVFR